MRVSLSVQHRQIDLMLCLLRKTTIGLYKYINIFANVSLCYVDFSLLVVEKSVEWKRYDDIAKIVVDIPLGASSTVENYYEKISVQVS